MNPLSPEELIQRSESDFSELSQEIEATKQRYLETLTNKDIPLDARWSMFLTAPSYVKENESDVCAAESITTLSHLCPSNHKSAWIDSHYDKNDKVYLADIADNVRYYQEQARSNPNFRIRNKYYVGVDYDELREEILSLNLESFIYDW